MKRKNYYLRALIIYIVVLALILGAALFVLNRFLVAYEATRPDNSVEAYMSGLDRDHWLGGLQELIDMGFSEFTLSTATPADFGIDEQGAVTWRSAGGDDSTKYYDVRMGNAKICTLSLIPGEEVGFGMKEWLISGEEYRMPGGSDISITVPTGCTAYINGVEVSGNYAVGTAALGMELEHSFDIAPSGDVYLIENMMGPAELKAYDAEGNELRANSISATEVEFYAEPEYSFTFCTTALATVRVNGTDISGSLCTPLDLGFNEESGILVYECSGLYSPPDIEVTIDSEKVESVELSFGESYIPGTGKDIEGEMAEFIEGFIYAYVDFSANKNRAAEANFAVLAQYLKPQSKLYTLTANSIDNIVWATTSGLEYNGIDYYDLIPLGNGRYICSISYDISYTLGVNDLDVKEGNLILIEETENGFRVADMSAAIR